MTNANIDTIKALFTYTIAFVVVVGGGIMLFVSRTDTGIDDVRVVVAGFIGSALTFVFGQEVSTRTARQAASSTLAAAITPAIVTPPNGNGNPEPTPPVGPAA